MVRDGRGPVQGTMQTSSGSLHVGGNRGAEGDGKEQA